MSFKESVERDNRNIFLNLNEFAERKTIVYDGERYENIPIVLTGIKEQDRTNVKESDHSQGLYLVTRVLHCSASDLKGIQPEKGTRIKIGDNDFLREYYVASSVCEFGMLCVELEAIDE